MRYFYDFEFEEDGLAIIPISLGMVAEDGRELYLVNHGYMDSWRYGETFFWKGHESKPFPWLIDNVLSHITDADVREFGEDYDRWGSRVQEFISNQGKINDRKEVELWGYYSAYDHVALAQMFGPMINLPKPIPMFTNDLMTIRRGREITFSPEKEHHALYDAKWNMKVWKTWTPRNLLGGSEAHQRLTDLRKEAK